VKKKKAAGAVVTAYRVGDGKHKLFDSTGATIQGGRWNSPGHSVIYASLSHGCAVLEMLARASIGKLPKYYKAIRIEIPASLIEYARVVNLPHGWERPDMTASRSFGDEWYASNRSAVLAVPSVLTKYDSNIVINTHHPDFRLISHSEPEDIGFDSRLIGIINKR
jgi:RES domain-containing protein